MVILHYRHHSVDSRSVLVGRSQDKDSRPGVMADFLGSTGHFVCCESPCACVMAKCLRYVGYHAESWAGDWRVVVLRRVLLASTLGVIHGL